MDTERENEMSWTAQDVEQRAVKTIEDFLEVGRLALKKGLASHLSNEGFNGPLLVDRLVQTGKLVKQQFNHDRTGGNEWVSLPEKEISEPQQP